MEGEEINLGIVPDKSTKECAPCCPGDSDKPQYPELCFRGKHAELFRGKYGNCAPGDEYTMTIRCKVKSSSAGESDWDNRLEMVVEALIGDVVEEEASEEATEEKPAAKPQRKVSKKTPGY